MLASFCGCSGCRSKRGKRWGLLSFRGGAGVDAACPQPSRQTKAAPRPAAELRAQHLQSLSVCLPLASLTSRVNAAGCPRAAVVWMGEEQTSSWVPGLVKSPSFRVSSTAWDEHSLLQQEGWVRHQEIALRYMQGCLGTNPTACPTHLQSWAILEVMGFVLDLLSL